MGSLSNRIKIAKIKPCTYRSNDIDKLRAFPISHKDDWSNKEFNSLKKFLRKEIFKTQKRRCAYCRRILNPDGGNEHLDHIVARKIKDHWMFKPRNLVLACYQCNTQKSATSTLNREHKRLPRRGRYYKLFNPYTHNWADHFELIDDLFISGKTKLGENTVKEIGLFDYKYSLKFAEESNTFGNSAIMRATLRLTSYDKKSIEYKSAKKLIKEIERHI